MAILSGCKSPENRVAATTGDYAYSMKKFRLESEGGCEGTGSSSCASYQVEYPEFEGLTPVANDSVQRHISELLSPGNPEAAGIEVAGREFIGQFESFLREFPEAGAGWYFNSKVSVLLATDTLLSLQSDLDFYTGGAHGSYGSYFVLIDPHTGASLSLDAFFSGVQWDALNRVGEEIFRAAYCDGNSLAEAGFTFDNDLFRLNRNAGFTSEGLLFVFNPYEIAPYAMGSQSVLIPYEKMDSLRR
jgi:hypothetical protein